MTVKIVSIFFAYIIGSIPVGVILTKCSGGADIRKSGSGNIGATNVYRVHGKTLGIMTLAGDALKGLLPTLIAVLNNAGAVWISVIALATFIGHLYPIFLQFKGGKGVATAMGIFIIISPLSLVSSLLVFALIVYKFRYVSAGSLSAAVAMPILVGLFCATDYKIYMILSLCVSTLVFYKHKENIKRLFCGEELKI